MLPRSRMPRADALSHSQNFAFFGRRDAAERGPTRRSSPFLDTRRLTTQENIEIAAVPKLPVAGWDQKFTGANALVLIQVLAGGRERSWMTAGEEENKYNCILCSLPTLHPPIIPQADFLTRITKSKYKFYVVIFYFNCNYAILS